MEEGGGVKRGLNTPDQSKAKNGEKGAIYAVGSGGVPGADQG